MPFSELAEQTIASRSGSFSRKVWTLSNQPTDPRAAVIFLDSELYITEMDSPATVERLVTQGLIPPVAPVFVSHVDAAARHADFTCNPDYAAFIAMDVVAWARNRYPTAQEFVIVGLSLSGLEAAYIATRYPSTFRAAVCQSPSFWWEQGRFAADLPQADRPGQEFWFCVGDRETEVGGPHPPSNLVMEMNQIQGCDLVCAAFRSKGYSISHRLYDGGHDPQCWREDLALALPWVWRRTERT